MHLAPLLRFAKALSLVWLAAARSSSPPDSDDAADTESVASACDDPSAVCDGETDVTEPLSLPTCRTSEAARLRGRGNFDDGPPRTWTDPETGDPRAACWFTPNQASVAKPLPLVVFFHGAGGGADHVYNATLLRVAAGIADLTGDRSRLGFVLVADEGRNLAYPRARQVGHHDDLFRRYDANPDVRHTDRMIDEAVATGVVDPKRIYVIGWSNSGFFAQAYGVVRHATPTPGGNRVAAVIAYTAADPFQSFDADQPECALPYPSSTVPIQLVHRSCDIVACDRDQAAVMGLAPGYIVGPWVETLRTVMNNEQVEDVLIDSEGKRVERCMETPPCTETIGLVNHVRWPDGVADRGDDHQPTLFTFLRAHPLP
jgi:dienelactone hydrolase